jgi:hypothetical protein
MLGLRAETDSYATTIGNADNHGKTHQFSERLTGRFFTSGVSGAFRRPKRTLSVDDNLPDRSTLRNKTEEKLRQDAERLYELENQLREVL